MQLEDEYPDPELAALQMLSKRANTPDAIPESVQGAMTAPVEGSISSVEGTATQPVEGYSAPAPVDQNAGMRRYADAATTQAGYRELPASAQPQQVAREQGFDWGRALTAFGGGDVGSYDSRKRYQQEAPMRDARFANEQADAQFQQQERVRIAREAQEGRDPTSPYSRDAQKEFAALSNGRANAVGSDRPDMQAFFAKQAENASQMSAVQIARAKITQDQLYGDMFKAIDSSARNQLAQVTMDLRERGVVAQEAMVPVNIADKQNDNAVRWAQLNQNDSHFQDELARKKAADEARAKAMRLRLQSKSVDKKAVEELQNIDGMEGMLNEAEAAIPKAYTGPGAGMAVKAADAVSAVTGGTVPMPDSLKATQTLQSNIENAIADMRKGRFGSSLTTGEQKSMSEWKPGTHLSEESNRNLISAMRKYMGYRAQQRVQQVFKETGMPLYIPPDKHLSLDDARKLKALYEGIDKYDDEAVAAVEGEANKILQPYGGGTTRPGSRAPAPQAQPSSALKAPPGATPGKRLRNPQDGKIYVVQPDGTMKPE